jgi:phasin family protein
MYTVPEQLLALNKAHLDIAVKFAGVAFNGAERLLDLQVKATKAAFADTVEGAKVLAAAKDLQQLTALKDSVAQPAIEKATAYARGVYDVATSTQAEVGKIMEQQIADYNKQIVSTLDKMVKTAPAGSEMGIAATKSAIAAVNSAYDNLSKIAKQFAEATQSNFEAVANQAANGAKKARKA